MLLSRRSMLGSALGLAAAPFANRGPVDAGRQLDMFAESDAYERFMGRWSRRLAPLFVRFAEVAADQDVLDIGSGTGALASAVAVSVPSARILGIDPSPAYVQYAQAHAPAARARFVVGDAQRLQLPSRSFDRTLSLLVMNFIPHPTRALREMIRVTRPGGVIAAAVWDYGAGMEMLRTFWDEAVARDPDAAGKDERNMPLCNGGELVSLWRAEGLAQPTEERLAVSLPFASFDDYWQPFLGGQGPAGAYVRSLSQDGRTDLEARLRKRLAPNGAGQPFALRAVAWAAKGIVAAR